MEEKFSITGKDFMKRYRLNVMTILNSHIIGRMNCPRFPDGYPKQCFTTFFLIVLFPLLNKRIGRHPSMALWYPPIMAEGFAMSFLKLTTFNNSGVKLYISILSSWLALIINMTLLTI